MAHRGALLAVAPCVTVGFAAPTSDHVWGGVELSFDVSVEWGPCVRVARSGHPLRAPRGWARETQHQHRTETQTACTVLAATAGQQHGGGGRRRREAPGLRTTERVPQSLHPQSPPRAVSGRRPLVPGSERLGSEAGLHSQPPLVLPPHLTLPTAPNHALLVRCLAPPSRPASCSKPLSRTLVPHRSYPSMLTVS